MYEGECLMSEKIRLYHTGFDEIRRPDVHYGRKNADFGQGFYTSPDEEFTRRWARTRRGEETILNVYELDLTGLNVHRFERDLSWFAYIYANRNRKPDLLGADAVIGPIANDTIYDTLGITTSGFLNEEQSLALLMLGPVYVQAALKTEKAASQLTWLSSEIITPEQVAEYRKTVQKEEAEFQKGFADLLDRI